MGTRKGKAEIELLKGCYLLPLNRRDRTAREGLCGSIYTQVSDVEDETNGLLTYDRQFLKVRPEELSDIGPRLQEAVRE